MQKSLTERISAFLGGIKVNMVNNDQERIFNAPYHRRQKLS